MTAIATQQLTKRYGDELALEGLDLEVERGEIFGFLGPNGAGKSTTINLLLGFVSPTDGRAAVLGRDSRTDAAAIRANTGVLAEGIDLYRRLTGRRHLELAIEWADGDESPDRLLDRVGLPREAGGQRVGEYSKGMRQRLALAMALAGDPAVLILDEPASGLDPNGIRTMREIVTERAAAGTAVFFSSHDLGQVEAVCDRVGILDEGRLVAVDTIDGLRAAVGAGAELCLHLSEPPRIEVSTVEGVADATYDAGRLRVSCANPAAKAHVVGHLLDAGQDIGDIDTQEVSLEDVFAAFTNAGSGGAGATDADEPTRTEVPA